jgi:ribose transport system substrate-binding protein
LNTRAGVGGNAFYRCFTQARQVLPSLNNSRPHGRNSPSLPVVAPLQLAAMNPTQILSSALCCALLALTACNKNEPAAGSGTAAAPGKKPRIAFISNAVDPFWNIAEAGVKAAAKEFNVDAQVHQPAKGLADQVRIIEAQLASGVDGIALSPIDAKNQVGLINQACRVTKVITHDSDAPDSKRLCFVGMNNYSAGRAAGKLVKEVIPNGGKVMLFVGRLESLNAQQRRQGIIDELLDRPEQALATLKVDPLGTSLAGAKYTVVDTRTDNDDRVRAQSNAEDAITAIPDLACMVGLYAYNPPACLQALKAAKKNGQIKLVAFDEQDATLQGILDGDIHGTVSQQPYLYGYHSVKILAGLARGDQTVLPKNGFLEVPIIQVRKDNAAKFWEELKKLKTGQ